MKTKVLNGILLLTSLTGYFEVLGSAIIYLYFSYKDFWLNVEPKICSTPPYLNPNYGTAVINNTVLFQKPHKLLSYIAIGCLGILITYVFGWFSVLEFKNTLSALLLFLACSIYIIHYHRNKGDK